MELRCVEVVLLEWSGVMLAMHPAVVIIEES